MSKELPRFGVYVPVARESVESIRNLVHPLQAQIRAYLYRQEMPLPVVAHDDFAVYQASQRKVRLLVDDPDRSFSMRAFASYYRRLVLPGEANRAPATVEGPERLGSIQDTRICRLALRLSLDSRGGDYLHIQRAATRYAFKAAAGKAISSDRVNCISILNIGHGKGVPFSLSAEQGERILTLFSKNWREHGPREICFDPLVVGTDMRQPLPIIQQQASLRHPRATALMDCIGDLVWRRRIR